MPIVSELFTWIASIHPHLVPGTLLHAATRCATNQELFFRRCFGDGRFEIDNGEVERQLRSIAIGRKNYLFAGSDADADRIATACTILGSAHMNDVDPLAYVTDVIARLQAGWPMSRIDELALAVGLGLVVGTRIAPQAVEPFQALAVVVLVVLLLATYLL